MSDPVGGHRLVSWPLLLGFVLLAGMSLPASGVVAANEADRGQAEGNLDAALDRDAEVAASLKAVIREVQETQSQIDAANRKLEVARAMMESSAQILSETDGEERALRTQLESKAIEGYKSGLNEIPIFLSDGDMNQSVRQAQLLEYANRSTTDLLGQLNDLREERRLAVRDAEQAAKEAELLEAELSEKLVELQDKQDEQLALKLEAEASIARWESELSAYAAEDAAIQALIGDSGLSANDIITDREASTLGFQWPVLGRVSSPYGYRIHPVYGTRKLHAGIDVSAPRGTPITATSGGTVIFAAWRGGYGNAVIIDHGGGISSLYGHLSSFSVGAGQQVERGALLGGVGATGTATGNHLHFEIRLAGTATDPAPYLP